MFRNFHQCLRLLHSSSPSADHCFRTLLHYIGKSLCTLALICYNGNALQNNSLKNSRFNHNHNNIPVDIKISLLQLFERFLSLHFAVKLLYLSYQLSDRLKTSATVQINDDIINCKSMKNPHNRFEKIRPECRLMSTKQNVSSCIVDGAFQVQKT